MRWVNNIVWNGQNYIAVTSDVRGATEKLPVSALANLDYSYEKTRKIKVTTNFSTWSTISIDRFQPASTFPTAISDGQEIYEFEVSGETFQIPAIVLMKVFFRPLKGLASYLFRPQSLDNIFLPMDSSVTNVRFFYSAQKEFRIQSRNTTQGTHAVLSWMYCFPSARRTWDSILENARKGKLGFQLPIGTGNLVLHAFKAEESWIVTKLDMISVSTAEVPFEFAVGHTSLIKFRYQDWNSANGIARPKQLKDIPKRGDSWSLSDYEWSTIKPILNKGRQQRHCLRTIMDCLLEKFGHGIAWRKLTVTTVNRPAIIWHYQEMLKDGRWELMQNKLTQLRTMER